MAKKHGLAKVVLGVGAAAVAGKVAFDKFKQTKERFAKEENDSFDDEIRKYNAIGEKKVIEVEDEVFAGCELKAVASKTVLDLGLAVFEKDVYINFSSNASSVTIILPEGVHATCDISRKKAGVKNPVRLPLQPVHRYHRLCNRHGAGNADWCQLCLLRRRL